MIMGNGAWMRGYPLLLAAAAACILLVSTASLLLLLLAAPPEGLPMSSHGASRNLQALPRIEIVGNNGGVGFPLGLCEGDCDRDSDCRRGLVCFQRGIRQSVPGCRGGTTDNSRGDYCVVPTSEVDNSANTAISGGDVEVPVVPSSTLPFELKLYWEPGYFWQEERVERKWCMKCRQGSSCAIGHQVYIVNCDRERPTSFVFLDQGAIGSQIQVAGSTLCLERIGRSDIRVQRCRATSSQLWTAPRGGFATRRFEIAPVGDRSRCMTQRHHPRRGELVQLEPCAQARGDTTSFWNRY